MKGFSQKKGIDFDEIFSPVVKMSSIRVVLGLAASSDLEIEQLDVKTAFLHGDLDEEIYMGKIPYASAVGSLMYAMVCTRPDIAHAVGVVSRFLLDPGKEHWTAVKWILRYLKGTATFCLCFGINEPMLIGYTDADMTGDVDSRKSTTGYLMTFSGGAV